MKPAGVIMQLWTDKHRPLRSADMVGQKKAVEQTGAFLDAWKPGKALLFAGPPGVGKTLLAETAAAERGLVLVQVNASDSRSAKDIERLLGSSASQRTLFHRGRMVVIDEVDGISGQERGAASAIVKFVKESRSPVILIANDPWIPKLRPLRGCSDTVKFGAVPYPSIAKRLREIARAEGIGADDSLLTTLAKWASGDLRSAILDLQLLAAGRESISENDMESLGFRERGKDLFDVLPTIFYSGSISAARKAIRDTDKDPDDVFWWVEGNVHRVFSGAALAVALEVLSKADAFRSLITKQQNWRFAAYMIDLISGISALGARPQGFVPFRPPDRLALMGQTREARALRESMTGKLGAHLHCSARKVKSEYLPFLKAFGDGETLRGLGLTEEELGILE